MSYLDGNNDIDDLFRRASDKYPLRTDSSDWDRLSDALEKDPSQILPPVTEQESPRRRRRLLWLLLLLPLAGIGYYAGRSVSGEKEGILTERSARATPAGTSMDRASTDKTPTASNATAGTSTTGTSKTETGTSKTGTSTSATSTDKASATDNMTTRASTTGTSKTGISTTSAAPTARPAQAVPSKTASGGAGTLGSVKGTRPSATDAADLPKASGTNGTVASGVQQDRPSADRKQVTNGRHGGDQSKTALRTGKAGNDDLIAAAGTTSTSGTTAAPVQKPTGMGFSGRAARDPETSLLSAQRANIANRSSVQVNVAAPHPSGIKKEAALTPRRLSKSHSAYFYGGLLVAPDLSTIKFQSVKGMGTTFGMLLGYQFNKKWAVETGVYLDRKKYYSDAEYFDKKNTPALNGVDLVNLNGTCNMVEMPVNLRYNFISGPKMKWFATTGLSTYLMYRQNYTFEIDQNNPWSKSWEYDTHYQNWFSIINLSLGFERQLGKIGNLRVEPYARIPLSGIGTGSLPILSAGLNIGITHRFW